MNVFGPSSHNVNANMAISLGNSNSQNITPGSQMGISNVGSDRIGGGPPVGGVGVGPNQHNAIPSPRRSER